MEIAANPGLTGPKQRDELMRIDAETLAIAAQAVFSSSVSTVEQGGRLWASLGDGRVVRLDPRSLTVEATRRVLSQAARQRGAIITKPAWGLGGLWVLAGDELDLELVRLDPTTLAVRSQTRIPTHGALAQALYNVVGNAGHVFLTGHAIAAVGANGKLIGRPVLVPNLETAAIAGNGLVGATSPPALVQLDRHGHIVARTALRDGASHLTVAGILGAALAPTDPAVMFSVLGNQEVGGRTGTILEGESGANDPVGIALMIGMLELARHHDASFWIVVREFSIEMAVGLAIGLAGAAVLLPLMRRSLPNEGLYPLRTLAAAATIYGVAAVAHGSGFLAVFIAGLLVRDARAPYKAEIERFHSSLANLAEIVVFVALGLTIDLTDLGAHHLWLDGLLLAVILAFLARPLAVGALLLPARMRAGERLFVMWGGLKGAVPILLATLALLAGVDGAVRLYGPTFSASLRSRSGSLLCARCYQGRQGSPY